MLGFSHDQMGTSKAVKFWIKLSVWIGLVFGMAVYENSLGVTENR